MTGRLPRLLPLFAAALAALALVAGPVPADAARARKSPAGGAKAAPKSACIDCHRKVTPGVVRQFLAGRMAKEMDCSGCHGAINAIRSMPVSNRNVADIQRAISENRGGMSFLSSLSVAQLQAIVDAMAAANP